MFAVGWRVCNSGKAVLEEKTMIDAMQPAVEALEAAVAKGEDTDDALRAASAAAQLGMKHTIMLQANER